MACPRTGWPDYVHTGLSPRFVPVREWDVGWGWDGMGGMGQDGMRWEGGVEWRARLLRLSPPDETDIRTAY